MAKRLILRLHESEVIELVLYHSANMRARKKATTMSATLRKAILASAQSEHLDLSRFGVNQVERVDLTVDGDVEAAFEALRARFPKASLTAIILGCLRETEVKARMESSQIQ